jgi:O-antigen/teichoic acid export membrane protein
MAGSGKNARAGTYDRNVGVSRTIGRPGRRAYGRARTTDPGVRRVLLRAAAILSIGGAVAVVLAIDWQSPVRVVLALGFLLFGPGLALGELLQVRDPVQRLALATGASLALETLVALALIYAGAYSPELAFAIVLGVSAAALAGAVARAVHTTASDEVDYRVSA